MNSRYVFRVAALSLCVALASGCGTTKNLFGKKSGAEPKPAALAEFKPSLNVTRLWSVGLGKGEEHSGPRQRPAAGDGRVYAAGGTSIVRALDLATGKTLWSYSPKPEHKGSALEFTGGPGFGDGLVVVGGLNGEVIALEASTGTERWHARVNNEVLSAPAIANGLVVVHSNDGRVHAFDAATGEKRWSWTGEAVGLSTRGTSAPVIGQGVVYVGTATGKVVALSLADGSLGWEGTVADADGRSEITRMNDVDGSPVLDAGVLYASSYKPRTAAFDAATGQPVWVQEHGGVGGLALSVERIVVSDANDSVWGLDKASGAPMWQQNVFARRHVSAPAIMGEYAVVGDFDGYLHWMRLADGQLAARARVGKPVVAQPVLADGIVLVQDGAGNLTAFRAGP